MEEDVMRFRKASPESGFSMVEMLMTALILAVGILGLTMLQAMSLQSSRGGRSLTAAVQIADRIMDQIEMEGRLSWLNITSSTFTAQPLTSLQYIGNGAIPIADYDIDSNLIGTGQPLGSGMPQLFFTAQATQGASVGGGATGQMHDFTVQVNFLDGTDASKAPITRTVTLTRRILHG
jgi:hypothetical protein